MPSLEHLPMIIWYAQIFWNSARISKIASISTLWCRNKVQCICWAPGTLSGIFANEFQSYVHTFLRFENRPVSRFISKYCTFENRTISRNLYPYWEKLWPILFLISFIQKRQVELFFHLISFCKSVILQKQRQDVQLEENSVKVTTGDTESINKGKLRANFV